MEKIEHTTPETIPGMIDVYGGDLSRWPGRELARRAAEAALADRTVRGTLDRARVLDRGLAAARAGIDAEIAASGAVGRVRKAVLSATRPRLFGRLQWAAAISVIVCGAGLGSWSDLRLAQPEALSEVAIVVDPIVFGPLESDLR